ncbi:S-layer homology domain-containing protein [Sporosalibacterium faouarense]|uniref:S-layer homology domain-containing protein n=1 Tax=Sporosalibacterium faouarense TaxID=516123 RepID=UPI00192CCF9B|nr:S-layer homology domain-containing protein [Sporosalibacterium faouarense]
MKKAISIIMIVTVVLTLFPTSIFVQGAVAEETYYGISTYRDLYGNINFPDIDGHWAQDSISRMSALSIIKGMGDGFYPNTPLTRDQGIALLVRLMGLEEEAQKLGEESIANEDTGGYVILNHFDQWTKGYTTEAQNQNIITPEEVDYITTLTPEEQDEIDYEVEESYGQYLDDENLTFNQLDAIRAELEEKTEKKYTWEKPVTREQMAMWIYRVLNLEPIYGEDQHSIYNLNDYEEIKTTNIPAIEAILQKGIMDGNAQGNFKPNGTISRGEMARLLDNIYESFLLDRGFKIGTGIVEDKDKSIKSQDGVKIEEIVLSIGSDDDTYINVIAQASDDSLYDNGFVGIKNKEPIWPDGIESHDYVKYYINPDNQAVFLEVLNKPETQIEGFVEKIDEENNTITIMDYDDNTYLYKINPAAKMSINGLPVGLKDMIYGLEVTLDIRNGNIESIRGELDTGTPGYIEPGGRIYIGKVLETDLNNDSIIIMDEDTRLEFEISPSTSIIKENEYLSLRSIREGDMVRLEFDSYNGNSPSKVYIASPDRQMENFIKARLNRYNPSRDELLLTDIAYFNYSQWSDRVGDMKMSLGGNAEIYIDGRKVSENDLSNNIGKEIYIVTNNRFGEEEASKIVFKNGYEKQFYNKLQRITYGDNKLRVDYNNMAFDESTIIEKNGRLIDPYNLRLDEELFVITQGSNNTAAFISVETPNDMAAKIYKGEIKDIYNYAFDLKKYDILENNKWTSKSNYAKLQISEETKIVDTRDEELIEVSVNTFNNNRFYTGGNTRFGYDMERDNFLEENAYVIEYDNMVSAIDIVDDFNGEEIITSARVDSVDSSNSTIAIKELKDWSDFRQKWNINTSEFDLKVENAILIKNGRKTTLDNIEDDDSLYIIRKDNEGHIIIAE